MPRDRDPNLLERIFDLCAHDDPTTRRQGHELAQALNDPNAVAPVLQRAAATRLEVALNDTERSVQHARARSILLCSPSTFDHLMAVAQSTPCAPASGPERIVHQFWMRRGRRHRQWWVPWPDDAVLRFGYCAGVRTIIDAQKGHRWAMYRFGSDAVRFCQRLERPDAPIRGLIVRGDRSIWAPRAEAIVDRLGTDIFDRTPR
ncbi:MAG: hypothetical protein AAFV53_23435 [Myxococcota bacterium]